MRVSRITLESLARQFAEVVLAPSGDVWYLDEESGRTAARVGAITIDTIQPGSARLYRLEQIINDKGGVTCPLGDTRYTAQGFYDVLRAALAAVRLVIGEAEYAKRVQRAFKQAA